MTRPSSGGTLVGPIFAATWPMELDLQSEDSILKLMWMASEAGEAFPEAVVAAVAPVLRATGRADR